MNKLLIYGLGDFARLMRTMFEQDGQYEVQGFCADSGFVNSDQFDGLPLCTLADAATLFSPVEVAMFVAVGYRRMRARAEMFSRARESDFALVNYVSPHAIMARNVQIGLNNAIFPGVQIEPGVRLGDNNLLWSSVNLCHDVSVGNHCFFAARALVGGNCTVGNLSFLGFNATVAHKVQLADETLVGACALVRHDTSPATRYLGMPASATGTHHATGILLP